MSTITVYTIIRNNYDNIRPPVKVDRSPDVDYICFSDQYYDSPPWKIYPAPTIINNGRDSRIPKILSHMFLDSDFSIYHDGCFQLAQSPHQLIEENLPVHADIAFYRHPCRKDVFQEFELCKRESIGFGDTMIKQVNNYRRIGVQYLWAGGFIIRRNNEAVNRFNLHWWNEYILGCSRDQIALPMAIKLSGIRVYTIDANIIEDPSRLKFNFHAAFNKSGDNPSFEEDRIRRMKLQETLRKLCYL